MASDSDVTKCSHGVTFDPVEAQKIEGDWSPKDDVEFILGNPAASEIKKRWPRLDGPCPLGCGYVGIAYASAEHMIAGDW